MPFTITFCQFWSTLVSLESAFNAEQEHDIIFCCNMEIKIQMKYMTEESFKPLLRLIVTPLVARVYMCK